MRRFLVASLAAFAVAIPVAGCGGNGGDDDGNGGGAPAEMEAETLDTTEIESGIEDSARQFGNEDVTVECPDDVAAEDGTTFECDVTLGGATGSVEVTLNSADGSKYDYDGKVQGDGQTTELSGQVS